jgi:hypothetical protein
MVTGRGRKREGAAVADMTERDEALLSALVRVGRPILLEVFRPDSCIISTRIGLDVLSYFGIRGKEYPVSAMIFNADAYRMLEETQDFQAVKEATDARTLDEEGGPWTIGLGAPDLPQLHPDGRRGWPGHLVIGLPQWNVVVDLSMDQVARPHKGLDLKPAWFPVPETWWTLEAERDFASFQTEDGAMMFLSHRNDHGYRQSPNWRGISNGSKQTVRAITGQIITALKAEGFTPR